MTHLKKRKQVHGASVEKEKKKVVPNKVGGGGLMVMSLTFFFSMCSKSFKYVCVKI